MPALRVVTWNIRAAIGRGPFPDRWWTRIDAGRLGAIGEFIGSLEADVVALQEVALLSRGGEIVDNAGDLARQLGWNARYGAVRTFSFDEGAGVFGNALLSRFDFADVRTLALPRAPMDAFVEPPGTDHPAAGLTYADAPESIREPRCLLLATVGGMRLGTAHLSHIGSGERRLQAGTIAAASPDALVGDLNAAIDAPELAPLSGWTDAFAVPAGDATRASTDDGEPIDHVLVRHGTVSAPAHVLTESGDLSDHYPVIAEITLSAALP